jgi:hypothetical protein
MKKSSLLSSTLFLAALSACHNPEEITTQENGNPNTDSSVVSSVPDSVNTTISSGEISSETHMNKDSVKVVNPTGIHHGSENQAELDSIKNEKLKKKN